MSKELYDVIIIGSGPAGLSAAVYAQRAELKNIVIEKNPISGGQIINTYEVDNYLGLPGINGFDLAMKFREHADKLGTVFVTEDVLSIEKITEDKDLNKNIFRIKTDSNEYESKSVLIATGASHLKLGAFGENEFGGRGVSYCATCDGAFFRKKTAVVVGGGDVAVEDAIFLSRICSKVYLIHRRNELRATKILQKELLSIDNIEVIWDSVVKKIEGNEKVEDVLVENIKTKEEKKIQTDACFIAVGIKPDTDFVRDLVECDEKGYVKAPESGETSVEGIYVAGDSRKKKLRQIVTAVADGANAITSIQEYLVVKS
ncbi:thioredoxin-disulfide reductase [Butyrivibrio sp. NC3005]|uniref:thioredoxin-disulfide reductase n=1 Tax=Butyrivibrio sp. NC3005 TaxID=1280685 RepID=UPI0003F9A304|nr:thioredoxin-disulfide reductase [Butyrivibrio sp. NC3005]